MDQPNLQTLCKPVCQYGVTISSNFGKTYLQAQEEFQVELSVCCLLSVILCNIEVLTHLNIFPEIEMTEYDSKIVCG